MKEDILTEESVAELHDKFISGQIRQAYNLNEYEYRIFICLLKNNGLRIKDLAKITNIPRSRIYDVCETLQRRKFIRVVEKHEEKIKAGFKREKIISVPTHYYSIPVEKIFENEVKRLRELVEERIKNIKTVNKLIMKDLDKNERI